MDEQQGQSEPDTFDEWIKNRAAFVSDKMRENSDSPDTQEEYKLFSIEWQTLHSVMRKMVWYKNGKSWVEK